MFEGWTLGADGYWTGPNGERLRAISGAQEFNFADFNMGGGGDTGGFDVGGAAGDFGAAVGQPGSVPISSYLPSTGGAADPTAFSGARGGGGFLDQLGGYVKQALPFVKLGTEGLGAYSGIRGMMDAQQQRGFVTSAEKTAQAAGAPGLAAGQQLIPAGTQAVMGGALPPQLEATVNNWKNNWRQQLRNYYARAGVQDSTMMATIEQTIEAQAQELRAQLAGNLLQSGLGAVAPALQGAQISGGLASHQQDATTAAITAANQALTRLLGQMG
jgi:hypothetical protein